MNLTFFQIDLLKNYEDSYENNINALFKMALERVAFLPFGLLIDLYRYGIFNGTTPDNQWNQQWEILRYKLFISNIDTHISETDRSKRLFLF